MNQNAFPRIGSALIVRDDQGRVLLGQRNKEPHSGKWIFPGGKILPFETIWQAGTRELREETGLVVEVEKDFGVYEIVDPPAEHRIVIMSWAKMIGGTLRPSSDLSDARFFEPSQIITSVPLTDLTADILRNAALLIPQ